MPSKHFFMIGFHGSLKEVFHSLGIYLLFLTPVLSFLRCCVALVLLFVVCSPLLALVRTLGHLLLVP